MTSADKIIHYILGIRVANKELLIILVLISRFTLQQGLLYMKLDMNGG